jgi:5'(3')-deoxyribonucleotidase
VASREFILGVDLDGVVADFYGGLRPIAAEWMGVALDDLPVAVTYGLPEWKVDTAPGGYESLHKFAVTQRNLFSGLEPMPGAPMALRRLSSSKIRIRVITHRLFIKYFHQEAVHQTIEWLDHHDIPYWDLCFMKDKTAVGADLYIEDSPENVASLRADGHPTLVFANSANEGVEGPRVDTWEEVEAYALKMQQDWLALQKSDE